MLHSCQVCSTATTMLINPQECYATVKQATDPGSFNLQIIRIVCVFRSFRLRVSFDRFSFSVRLRFVRVIC